MIAKVLPAGEGFRGTLNYTLQKDEAAEIVATNMAGETPRDLAREFSLARDRRPDIQKPVFHAALSLPPGEKIDAARWGAIAGEFMEQMGFTDRNQWIAIRHGDTDQDHIHIVASRIGMDGKIYKSSNDGRRARRVADDLEIKYGLQPVSMGKEKKGPRVTKNELEAAQRQGRAPARIAMHAEVTAALQGRPTLTDFRDRLARVGIETRAHLDQAGKVRGLSFARGDATFAGSQLSKKLAWKQLRDQLNSADGPAPAWARPAADEGDTVAIARTDAPTAADRAKAAIMAKRYKRRIDAGQVKNVRWTRLTDDGLEIMLRDGSRLLDTGDSISLSGPMTADAIAEMCAAADRNDWSAMKLTGSDAFKRAMVAEAVKRGIRVTNPELADLQAQLMQEVQSVESASPDGGRAAPSGHPRPAGGGRDHLGAGGGAAREGGDGTGTPSSSAGQPERGNEGPDRTPDSGGGGTGQSGHANQGGADPGRPERRSDFGFVDTLLRRYERGAAYEPPNSPTSPSSGPSGGPGGPSGP